jgi:hypothetical protein
MFCYIIACRFQVASTQLKHKKSLPIYTDDEMQLVHVGRSFYFAFHPLHDF